MTVSQFLAVAILRTTTMPGLSTSAIQQNLYFLSAVIDWAVELRAITKAEANELQMQYAIAAARL